MPESCTLAGTPRMVRVRAPTGQGLGFRRLDGDEALPLQALEDRARRRQQFTALTIVLTPACDRRLDGDDQERGRRPSVTRFHRRAADPGEPFRSRRSHPRQQGPQQPTRSGRSLFPATPMISGAAIAVGYRLRRDGAGIVDTDDTKTIEHDIATVQNASSIASSVRK